MQKTQQKCMKKYLYNIFQSKVHPSFSFCKPFHQLFMHAKNVNFFHQKYIYKERKRIHFSFAFENNFNKCKYFSPIKFSHIMYSFILPLFFVAHLRTFTRSAKSNVNIINVNSHWNCNFPSHLFFMCVIRL